jgi:hypothetical protein
MMKKNFLLLTLALGLIPMYYSCNQNTPAQKSENEEKEAVKTDSATQLRTNLNDIADFFTGIPVEKSSFLYDYSQTPEWEEYSHESQVAWARFDSVAKKYKDFSKKEIQEPYNNIKTLFYPFSGPDFLFANILFPNVDKMYLIGLESPGSVPVIDSTLRDSLKTVLNLYKVSIEDVTQLSFFRTIDMKNELGNKAIDGTTPILMLFLAKSGKEIVSVTPMLLDKKGELKKTDNKHASAVKIEYTDKGDDKIKQIIYLSTNLADPTLSQNTPFMNFLNGLEDNMVTFVKSATYLMHKSYFSIIRNTCLNKSKFILQDDSGIAFKFFKKDKWDIQLYGTYSKPIKLFEDFYEKDYYDAFKTDNPKPLKFRIGYSPKSNLLIAIKK